RPHCHWIPTATAWFSHLLRIFMFVFLGILSLLPVAQGAVKEPSKAAELLNTTSVWTVRLKLAPDPWEASDFPELDRAQGLTTALFPQRGSRAAQEPSPAGWDDLQPVFRKPNPESLEDLKGIEGQ